MMLLLLLVMVRVLLVVLELVLELLLFSIIESSLWCFDRGLERMSTNDSRAGNASLFDSHSSSSSANSCSDRLEQNGELTHRVRVPDSDELNIR